MTNEPFPSYLARDPEWEARKDRLWAMTADERVAAMRAGELTYRELAHWSARRPDEVPRVCTGHPGAGEFEWLIARLADHVESRQMPQTPPSAANRPR